jgi:beta-glucosidase
MKISVFLLCISMLHCGNLFSQAYQFQNKDLDIETRVDDLLKRLTLEEKAFICHGTVTTNTAQRFTGGGIARLNIGALNMLDGRQGVRPVIPGSPFTTALPATLSLSCMWNTDAAADYSQLIAQEMLYFDQHVLLAPCMNLMRSPLGGRNFENLGEDPYLAGKIAAANARGTQSIGVGSCACILVANDYESWRHFTSSNMDQRTLREMHFLPFEMAITEGNIWTIMTANSLLNGVHNAESKPLLQDLIKDELGYDGVILTDWRAAYRTVPSALAGQDMTTGFCAYVYGDGALLEAVQSGKVPEALLDEKARRILRLYIRSGVLDPDTRGEGALDTEAHRETARKLGAEGMVLLKNETNLLPIDLKNMRNIVVTGPAANTVPYGTGSGHVKSSFAITPLQGIQAALQGKANVKHVPFNDSTSFNSKELDILLSESKAADLVIVAITDARHGEGNNRNILSIGEKIDRIIPKIHSVNTNVIVVLFTAGVIDIESWADEVPTVLGAWYAGQSTGDALADVLTGKVNPGGKLSFTWGKQLDDYACHSLNLWPSRPLMENPPTIAPHAKEERVVIHGYDCDYDEGVFMGYRWFDEHNITPRYPFGHGLSYTSFSLEDAGIQIPSHDIDSPAVSVKVKVSNTGHTTGSEVVQVYVGDVSSSVPRPPRELKGFVKVELKKGETREVSIPLDLRSFAFYSNESDSWVVEPGEFIISVGNSSRNISYEETIALR